MWDWVSVRCQLYIGDKLSISTQCLPFSKCVELLLQCGWIPGGPQEQAAVDRAQHSCSSRAEHSQCVTKMPLAWVSINTVSMEVARLGVSIGEVELCFSRHVLSSGRFLIPTLCQLLLVFPAPWLLPLPFLVASLSPMFCTYPAACSQWDTSISLGAQSLWPWGPSLGSLSCCRSCSVQQCWWESGFCHRLCSYWNTHVRLSGMWTQLLELLKNAWIIIKFLAWHVADD